MFYAFQIIQNIKYGEKNIIYLKIANFQIQEKNICHNNTETGRFWPMDFLCGSALWSSP